MHTRYSLRAAAAPACSAIALPDFAPDGSPAAGELQRQLIQHLGGVIAGAVVDGDHFDIS